MKILFYAAGLHQWRPSNPQCWWKDIPSPAGTELGIYGYCRALKMLGHEVTVVMPTDPPGIYDGVEYLNPPYTIEKGVFDVILSMHYADPLNDSYAPLQICIALSHHMVGIEGVMGHVDRYMTPSRWGMERLIQSHPSVDTSKFWITRIGVWLEDQFGWFKEDMTGILSGHPKEAWCWWSPYDRRDFQDTRDPKHLVWASSPDRGLWHMVDIMNRLPEDYHLTVAYDFDDFLKRSDHIPTLLTLRKALPLKDMTNVEFVGHLTQPKLRDLFETAGLLVYPGDVPETYAVTINQACAAGLPAMVSGIGSFPENYGGAVCTVDWPVHPDTWAHLIQTFDAYPEAYKTCQENELKLASLTDFYDVAKEWEQFFTRYLNHDEDRTQMDKSLASLREKQ